MQIKNLFIRVIFITLQIQGASCEEDLLDRSFLETNQFLQKTQERVFFFHNTSAQPLTLKFVESRDIILGKSDNPVLIEAPTGTCFSLHQSCNSSGFPIIEDENITSKIHIKNHSSCDRAIQIHTINTIDFFPFEEKLITAHESYVFHSIALENNKDLFCALTNINDETITFSFQTTYVPIWQTLAMPYDFLHIAVNTKGPELNEDGIVVSRSTDNRSFLYFRDYILPQSGVSPIDFYSHIAKMYNQNLSFIQKISPLNSHEECRIEKTIYTIWLTNKENPKKIIGNNLLNRTMHICRPEDGWNYVIWYAESLTSTTYPTDLLEGIDQHLKQYIHIRHPNDLECPHSAHEFFQQEFKNKRYGRASDILRCEILLKGGVYRDTDFEFIQSPEWLHYHLDFYGGMERISSVTANNAMIAARPEHPIIYHCLNKIVCNYTKPDTKIKIHPTLNVPVLSTLVETGPFLLSLAFYFASNQNQNRDMLFPSTTFFWSIHDNEKKTPLETIKIRRQQVGIHYCDKSWITHPSDS